MKLHYFADTDTLACALRDEPATETEDLTDDVLVDYNVQRQIVLLTIEHASKNVDLAALEIEDLPTVRLSTSLFAYVRRRLEEVEIDASDLDGLDVSSPAFQIVMRHGMTMAFHEMEHLLLDTQPSAQGATP
jgi:uncharacterized protein YuzE